MNGLKYLFFFFLIACNPCYLFGFSNFTIKGPHRVYLGPEFYYARRYKEGGSKQSGWLFGGRVEYERRLHKGLYWAVDGYYAHGDLSGKTASGKKLQSELTDREIEGRAGYAFCFKDWKRLTFIPFGGYGEFKSTNNFVKPSPLPCEYEKWFDYGTAGFLIAAAPKPCLECGVGFKAKFMLEGKCKIKDDPENDNIKLIIENKTQYEVDLPFRYYTCWRGKNIDVVFSPFYRFRHYGGRVNWPFDFIDTKYRLYGANFLLNVLF